MAKASLASLMRALKASGKAAHEAGRQQYEKEYASGAQLLPWGLKNYLDGLGGDKYGEGINDLLKQQGDMGVLQQRAPNACPAIVGYIARVLKLSPHAVAAALDLPPARDELDMLLLDTLRERSPEARNGLLPLHCIVDVVNAGCGPHDGLSSRFISGRLRALGCVLTAHHPAFVCVIPKLLPPMLDAVLLLPSPEESNVRKIEK